MTNEVCNRPEGSKPKNIGGKQQCLEAPVKTFALAKEGFSFATKEAAKTEAAWRTAIENKDVVMFPFVEGITPNITEANIKNGRYRDYTLKPAIAGSTYRMDLAVCTHEAVKSYEKSEYTRIFRITDKEELSCDIQTDGTVKGQSISSFLVGVRNEATTDDVPFTDIGIKYRNEAYDILLAEFDISELEGVHDVDFVQVTASATSIRFKAFAGCSGAPITNLEDAEIQLLDLDDATVAVTFVPADEDGVYELTGTDFASGFKLTTDGVVDKIDLFYENTEPLIIVVT